MIYQLPLASYGRIDIWSIRVPLPSSRKATARVKIVRKILPGCSNPQGKLLSVNAQ
jgi:hypothetical protein